MNLVLAEVVKSINNVVVKHSFTYSCLPKNRMLRRFFLLIICVFSILYLLVFDAIINYVNKKSHLCFQVAIYMIHKFYFYRSIFLLSVKSDFSVIYSLTNKFPFLLASRSSWFFSRSKDVSSVISASYSLITFTT